MLTPEQMGDAGETVAEVYRQIEAELIEWLVQKMYEEDLSGQRFRTALGLLSQKDIAEATRIVEAHAQEVDAAVLDEVKTLLAASDAFDLAAIARGIGATIATDALTVQTLLVVAAVREAMARDNLEMAAAARTKFLQWSTWAATQVSTGNMTADKALRKATRELARGGLSIESVTYRDPETGKVTITNKADVAVARHVRSLIGQGAAQLTFERMRENGVEFVEVSSHAGARPSHAKWHGRCYHIGADITVDGVLYPDFFEGTGYRGERGPYTALGDQLLGVNCRHSFAPWVPGSPRAYEAEPKHPSGLSNDEIYNLTQGQRARERKIREAKRELSAAQIAYDTNPSPENAAEVTRAKQLLKNRQESMREYIKEANAKCKPGTEVLKRLPNREWSGDMPKVATQKELSVYHSNVRKTATPQWDNKQIASLKDGDAAEKHLREEHEINVSPGFKEQPLQVQKEIAAGIADAKAKYGNADINTITVMQSKNKDGTYNPDTGTVRISTTASSHYLAAFHETIHAIDAEKSSKMPGFDKMPSDRAYTMHSEKVLKEARKAIGLKANSKTYKDLVLRIMGMDLEVFEDNIKLPYEIVAYALDYEAQGKSNLLSKAIKERF